MVHAMTHFLGFSAVLKLKHITFTPLAAPIKTFSSLCFLIRLHVPTFRQILSRSFRTSFSPESVLALCKRTVRYQRLFCFEHLADSSKIYSLYGILRVRTNAARNEAVKEWKTINFSWLPIWFQRPGPGLRWIAHRKHYWDVFRPRPKYRS